MRRSVRCHVLALVLLVGGGLASPAQAAPAPAPGGGGSTSPCVVVPPILPPASGSIDRYFGCGGVRVTTAADSTLPLPVHLSVFAATRLPDNRILVVGNRDAVGPNSSDTLVARYTANGALDPTFGSAGIKLFNASSSLQGPEEGTAVLVQTDGRIVVVGLRSNETFKTGYVARLLADGALDSTFGQAGTGIVVLASTGIATGVATDGTGGYYVSGRSCPNQVNSTCSAQLIHVLADGSLDPSFGSGGTLMLAFAGGSESAQAVSTSSGRMAVVGNTDFQSNLDVGNLGVARFSLTGSLAALDTSFSGDGRLVASLGNAGGVNALVLQGDGSMWVGGAGSTQADPLVDRFALTRIPASGASSVTTHAVFPSTNRGVMRSLVRHGERLYGAGGVVTTAGARHLALAAFKLSGALDTSFSGDGMVALNLAGELRGDRRRCRAIGRRHRTRRDAGTAGRRAAIDRSRAADPLISRSGYLIALSAFQFRRCGFDRPRQGVGRLGCARAATAVIWRLGRRHARISSKIPIPTPGDRSMSLRRKALVLFASGLLVLAAGAAQAQAQAQAQAYPTRTITLVAPYAAGGDSDFSGRNLAAVVQKYLGQNAVVLNRAGGSGMVGSQSVRTATPDGYTLLICSWRIASDRAGAGFQEPVQVE